MSLTPARHQLAFVLITIGRDSLLRAVRSIFRQKFNGRIQVLIGVDIDIDNRIAELQQTLKQECPANVSLLWLNLGYSTSKRHGGVHDCFYGGSLRSALTLLADAEIVSYLDDDDWLLENHSNAMFNAFAQHPEISWAHSLCYYADGNTGQLYCLDELESVGVGAGLYKNSFGGFVRPSGLTINKLKTLPYIHTLSGSLNANGDGEDRLLFNHLRTLKHARLEFGTVCCALDPKDAVHSLRVQFIQQRTGKMITLTEKIGSTR